MRMNKGFPVLWTHGSNDAGVSDGSGVGDGDPGSDQMGFIPGWPGEDTPGGLPIGLRAKGFTC